MDSMNLNDKIRAALGMDEVMDALDQLVKSATVGGKKEEKKPDQEDEIARFKPEMMHLARLARTIHNCFCEVGFDDDQAFELALEMVRSFNMTAESECG